MRCRVCGAQVAAADRCAICGHWLPAAARVDPGPERSPGPAREAFVGRQRELAVLGAALDDALAGRGRLVLVVGEPGIGKTRLAAELLSVARDRGAQVLAARAAETEGAPPYWPWAQIIRSCLAEADPDVGRADLGARADDLVKLIPQLSAAPLDAPAELRSEPAGPAGADAERARFRSFDAFARALGALARRQALVLVLDDLHWFDTPSLRLLEFVSREIADTPVLILATYRDAGLDPAHALWSTAGALVREPTCQTVHLDGLTADEVARFVERAAGEAPSPALVKTILKETEGNPFFVTEIVRLFVAERRPPGALDAGNAPFPVPHGVRAAIGRRLASLSAPCRKVLVLAAVLGREFGAPALDALGAETSLGPTGDWLQEALDEAVDARLITVVPQAAGRYGFTHTLIREALYEELNPARRARLHRDIARVLERLAGAEPAGPPSVDAGPVSAELAYHHLQALPAGGDVERAIGYATRAGGWAMAVLAYEDAVLHYRRALEGLELDKRDDPRQGEALLRLGHAHVKAGDVALAQDAFERALSLARRLRAAGESPAAGPLLARAALGLGGEWWVESPEVTPRYADLLEEALRALDPADSDLRAQVLSRLAIALYFVPGAAGRRLALSETAVAMARRLGDAVTLSLALCGRHWALWDPARLDERLAVTDELVRLAQGIGARELELRSHGWRLAGLLELGDIDAVDTEIEAFARLAAELRQPMYQWWTPMLRAMRALLDGRLADTERLAEEGMAAGQRAQGRIVVPIFGGYLIWLRRAQGRLAEMEAVVKGMVDQHPAEPSWRAVLAYVYSELGRVDEAQRELDRLAAAEFTDMPRDLRWLPSMAMLAQVAASLGDARRAALLYDLMLPYRDLVLATAGGAGPCLGAASRYLGVLAMTLHRWDDAERHLQDAIALNARMRARPLTAFAQHEYGTLLVMRDGPGDRARGHELIAAALGTARELGMTALRERIESGGGTAAVREEIESGCGTTAVRERIASGGGTPSVRGRTESGEGTTATRERTGSEGGRAAVRGRIESEGGTTAVRDSEGAAPADAESRRPAAASLAARAGSRPSSRAAPVAVNVFRRDGEYWTVIYQEGVCRLKDAKGLHYLSALVREPGREFHVLDLAALTETRPRDELDGGASPEQLADEDLHVARTGDVTERLDARARETYKRRVQELRAELDEARRFNDTLRAARLREEIDFLGGELAQAYGLGGRAKRAGGDEQVRKNVTNCIRNSVARIAKSHPALARHLRAAVKTGVFCAYRPEQPVSWTP